MPIKLFIGTKVHPEIISNDLETIATEGWRWAPRQQWHVTTLFIGYKPQEELVRITQSIERVAAHTERFSLHRGELKAMPEERPSMLWVRFAVSPELSSLHVAMAEAIGVPASPYSPYWPHITFARGSGPIPKADGSPIMRILPIAELTLFRSDPGPNGTVHTPLASWPLA